MTGILQAATTEALPLLQDLQVTAQEADIVEVAAAVADTVEVAAVEEAAVAEAAAVEVEEEDKTIKTIIS